MLIVMERLITGRDGVVRVGRREWNYNTIAFTTKAKECKMSALAIWAMLNGLTEVRVVEGRQVWESSVDSSRMFLEAQK